ncbi:MAG: DUF5989 family protein [Candidatus Omnitrophica bacterium]|nr:DUF5989 family protein [Candidatus Omnitrophota bacterium]
MSKFLIIREFFGFLKSNKKWWLAPIVIVLLLLGIVIFFGQSSVIMPFIYTVF